MRVHPCSQRSEEWHTLRATRIGGSDAGVCGTTLRNGAEPAGRRDVRVRAALARLHPTPHQPGFMNSDMARGVELEALAVSHYEVMTGATVKTVGYCTRDDLPGVGYSPDGLVGSDGVVEIKAPRPANHLASMQLGLADTMPAPSALECVPGRYHQQLLHGLLVTERAWIDFVSFCPDFPLSLQLHIVRVERSEVSEAMTMYQQQLQSLLDDIERTVTEIRGLLTP